MIKLISVCIANTMTDNDGFKTKLIGTAQQIAERLILLKALGASIVLTAFLHYEEEIEQFGREVLPLVRQMEAEGRGTDEAYEVERTGWVYGGNKDQNVKGQEYKRWDTPNKA